MLCSENAVLCLLAKYRKDSIFALAAKYRFSPVIMSWPRVWHASSGGFGIIFL